MSEIGKTVSAPDRTKPHAASSSRAIVSHQVEELRQHGQRGRQRKPQTGERGAAAFVPAIRSVQVGEKRPVSASARVGPNGAAPRLRRSAGTRRPAQARAHELARPCRTVRPVASDASDEARGTRLQQSLPLVLGPAPAGRLPKMLGDDLVEESGNAALLLRAASSRLRLSAGDTRQA